LWENLPFPILKDSVFAYTAKVAAALQPDFIQIGNEINNGFLHPLGSLGNPPFQFLQLLDTALLAVRQEAPQSKIVIHYAGITGADWFFNQLTGLDFDVIGLSYYPIWHGKSLPLLQQTLADLAAAHQKEIIIAETAYPFTLGWNDWTHNVVGTNDHLILPDFPATPAGQKAFLAEIRALVQSIPQGLGFCYWGAEMVAWRGPAATNGSPWENQALFDFNHVALPALGVFGE
jgi:arabinogalactan endo-1,4-beta-galactosidase